MLSDTNKKLLGYEGGIVLSSEPEIGELSILDNNANNEEPSLDGIEGIQLNAFVQINNVLVDSKTLNVEGTNLYDVLIALIRSITDPRLVITLSIAFLGYVKLQEAPASVSNKPAVCSFDKFTSVKGNPSKSYEDAQLVKANKVLSKHTGECPSQLEMDSNGRVRELLVSNDGKAGTVYVLGHNNKEGKRINHPHQ